MLTAKALVKPTVHLTYDLGKTYKNLPNAEHWIQNS